MKYIEFWINVCKPGCPMVTTNGEFPAFTSREAADAAAHPMRESCLRIFIHTHATVAVAHAGKPEPGGSDE